MIGAMTRRFRAYARSIDTWFYYEFGEDGRINRQIELEGPDQVPTAAADLAEWNDAVISGSGKEYLAKFGAPGDATFDEIADMNIPEPEDLTLEQFEEAWQRARRLIQAGTT